MTLRNNQIRINNVRLSYVHVFKPESIKGGDPKYSVQLIMDKDDPQLKDIRQKILNEAKVKWPDRVTSNKLPASLRNPLRDGDEERNENDTQIQIYGNKVFFNANSNKRPPVFGRDNSSLTEEDNIIYSGCYGNVIVSFYGYDRAGNRGIACGLDGVQFKRDGEALGDGMVSADDFDTEEDDYDDGSDLL